MPRDKEKKRRDDANDRTLTALKCAFPLGKLCEVKLIPRLSAIAICDTFKGMERSARQEWLRTQIGDELYSHSYIRIYTTLEYAQKLEERANPMD